MQPNITNENEHENCILSQSATSAMEAELTLDGEDDVGAAGLGAEVVLGLAAVARAVVLGGGDEGVGVPALAARRRVRLVDQLAVAQPGQLGQRVAARRRAHQRHRLPQPDRLPLDVAGDLRRSWRICKRAKEGRRVIGGSHVT